MTSVAFYVKAGEQTGYGHIIRCLALAQELKARGVHCRFLTNFEGRKRARASGFPTQNALKTNLGLKMDPDVWIVDLEGGCSPSLANDLRFRCKVLVILNGVGYPDGDPGRLVADLVFYQGQTQRPYHLSWPDFCGEWFEGPDWLILGKDFQSVVAMEKPVIHAPPRVVICGGGSDPKNVTALALDALKDTHYQCCAIVGPANTREYGYNPRNAELVPDPPNMAEQLAWADVAIVSYGMTAFECLALGVPVVALSISEDHVASAQLVARRSSGALLSLGRVESADAEDIRWGVGLQLSRLPGLSLLACEFVDGRGAGRVADKILGMLEWKTKNKENTNE